MPTQDIYKQTIKLVPIDHATQVTNIFRVDDSDIPKFNQQGGLAELERLLVGHYGYRVQVKANANNKGELSIVISPKPPKF